jgi:aminoglycoside phosphotransferase (APT) family kinase protein
MSIGDVANYLAELGLVEPDSMVDGPLCIFEASGRHRCWHVIRDDGRCYLLKQAYVTDRGAALAHEAVMYERLQPDHTGRSELGSYLPRYFGYDRHRGLLVLERTRSARTLREYHVTSGNFSRTLAAALGKALACLHGLRLRRQDADLGAAQPWVLAANRPGLAFVRDFSDVGVQLIRIVQQYEELCRLLDRARASWRGESLIHNDVRWSNCLVLAPSGARRTTRLRLIDWELAGVGDPRWDVGCALAEYLSFWLLSIPASTDTPVDDWPELARHPLEDMQPAIARFWVSYAARAKPRSGRQAFLIGSTLYAGARLVQNALEQLQMAPRLSAFAVLAVQLALNIMRHPERAAAQLLALPLEDTALNDR